MSMQYGEHVLAARGGMARAANVQERAWVVVACHMGGRRPSQLVKTDRFAPKVLKLVGEGQSCREVSHRLGLSRTRFSTL
jgi:hypothetical protein